MGTEMVSVTASYWDTLRRRKEKQVTTDRGRQRRRKLGAPLGGSQGTLVHFQSKYISIDFFFFP